MGIDGSDAGNCGWLDDGTAECWGNNANGVLGVGSVASQLWPVRVVGASRVSQVSVGYGVSCLIHEGRVACAGLGGLLGDGSTASRATYGDVSIIDDALGLTTGACFACALRKNGSAWCWGDVSHCPATSPQPVPVLAAQGPYSAITGGNLYACALRFDGGIDCWGDNQFGQLGDGSKTSRTSATPVQDLDNAIAIAAASTTTCAVRSDATVWCWGDNQFGGLADPSVTDRPIPGQVVGLHDVVELSARTDTHFCARNGQDVWCWGGNQHYQLGTISPAIVWEPRQIQFSF
jgi:alpha-tubulin suppressor-like RCC1 family protein